MPSNASLVPCSPGYTMRCYYIEVQKKWQPFCRLCSNPFACMEVVLFWFEFYLNLSPSSQSTINQWANRRQVKIIWPNYGPVDRRIYASLSLGEWTSPMIQQKQIVLSISVKDCIINKFCAIKPKFWILDATVVNMPSPWCLSWKCSCAHHIWGMLCREQVSRAGTSNYIPQILWDVITCPLIFTSGTAFIILYLHAVRLANNACRSHLICVLVLGVGFQNVSSVNDYLIGNFYSIKVYVIYFKSSSYLSGVSTAKLMNPVKYERDSKQV